MYKFCKANGSWWRVCSSLNELMEWHEQMNGLFGRVLLEDVYDSGEKYKNIRDMARIYGEKHQKSFIEGLSMLSAAYFEAQRKTIEEGKEVWIGPKGGWNFGLTVDATVYMNKNIFPNFKKSDIRITKFGMYEEGKHFYAYIGDIQIFGTDSNGGKITKWNTRDAAYEAAMKYCEEIE